MPIPKWLQWLSNATIKAAIAENPAVATASGWTINNEEAQQNATEDPGVKQLQKNLTVLGGTATGIVAAPLVATPTAAKLVGDAAASMLGGEVVDKTHRALTGQSFGRGVATIFGQQNVYNRSALARFGYDALNPGYFAGNLVAKGTNAAIDAAGSALKNAKQSMIDNGILGFNGRLIQKEIPYNPNNFYRRVGFDAIKDANESGLIRGNRYNNSGPYFGYQRGNPTPDNVKTAVIEGTPNSAEQWVDSWRARSRRQFIKDNAENNYLERKLFGSLKSDTTGSSSETSLPAESFWTELRETPIKDIREPIVEKPLSLQYLDAAKSNNQGWLMEFGTEVFPMTNGKFEAPASKFKYWKKHPIIGWRQHKFTYKEPAVDLTMFQMEEPIMGRGRPKKSRTEVPISPEAWDEMLFEDSIGEQGAINAARKASQAGKRVLKPITEAEKLGIPKGERNALTQDQLEGLSDLYYWKTQGRFKNKFGYNPQTETFRWSTKLNSDEVPGIKALIDAGGSPVHIDGPVLLTTKPGNFKAWPGKNAAYSANFPIPEGMKWGPGDTSTTLVDNSGHEMKFILTSPKVDAIDNNLPQSILEQLPNTIDKDIMKRYWTINKQMIRPGTYLSGDNGASPLGAIALRTFDSGKNMDAAISDILYFKYNKDLVRQGLSPDSWSSLVRQGSRPGIRLRWGQGFQKWNDSAVQNKDIYTDWVKMKNGEITSEQYKEIFDNWSLPQGGRPLEIIRKPAIEKIVTDNNGLQRVVKTEPQTIVNIPHPYIMYENQGGILSAQLGTKLLNKWQQLYNSKFGKGLRNFMYGYDHDLSDEEYIQKYGYAKPYASAGMLEFLSPGEAAKLLNMSKELKVAESAARAAKEAQSAKEAQLIRDAAEVKIGKSGRVHFKGKSKGSGKYVKTASTNNMSTTPVSIASSEEESNAYMNAIISAQNASKQGLPGLAKMFYEDAARLNPQPDAFKARFLWGELYEDGGKVKSIFKK